MAIRPAYFVANDENILVKTETFDFKWHPGFAVTQKQKSIEDFHTSIHKKYPDKKILEVSSKSKDDIGTLLSAFNLTLCTKKYKKTYTVETLFQSSKVFENGGPYYDLLDKTSREAKKDSRIRNSGELLYFMFFQERWDLKPRTAFYDWIYINALNQHQSLIKDVIQYECFTDIEFNPEKSINCQANSVALFVSLYKKQLLNDALKSKEQFLNIIKCIPSHIQIYDTKVQGSLL
jgi:hypothetical protein